MTTPRAARLALTRAACSPPSYCQLGEKAHAPLEHQTLVRRDDIEIDNWELVTMWLYYNQ